MSAEQARGSWWRGWTLPLGAVAALCSLFMFLFPVLALWLVGHAWAAPARWAADRTFAQAVVAYERATTVGTADDRWVEPYRRAQQARQLALVVDKGSADPADHARLVNSDRLRYALIKSSVKPPPSFRTWFSPDFWWAPTSKRPSNPPQSPPTLGD